MNITGSSDFDLLQNGVPLPLELFTVIGEFLIGESKFASLANLNETDSLIREATNAVPDDCDAGCYRPKMERNAGESA
jgi:hypothetical protein